MSRTKGRFKKKNGFFKQWMLDFSYSFKQLFRNKKILVISEKGITSVPMTSRFQAMIVLAVMSAMLWFSYSTGKYFAYEGVISEKDREIWSTSLDNESLQYQLTDLHENLSDLNQYFTSIQAFDQVKGASSGQEVAASEVNAEVSDDGYLESEDIATDSRKLLLEIRKKVHARIKSIESLIEMTGLNLKEVASNNPKLEQMLAEVRPTLFEETALGGPYEPVDLTEEPFERELLQGDIAYLLELEKLLHSYPLASPIQRYYVSSHYGRRVDPVRHTSAMHGGIDLVGAHKGKVNASAPGTVIHARRYGAYGNFVEIDHGNGITTRYGHLSRVLVRKGQKVARGDVIGLQGNTGRSTGSHLHYEVRFNNKTINPKYFLKAGTYVF